MRILEVRLGVAVGALDALGAFYGDRLGLGAHAAGGSLAVEAGGATVRFDGVEGGPFHHFALRVPRDRFDAARAWLADRGELLADETGERTFRFDFWNAEACYVHDPAGNIVELIAHHELPEETRRDDAFDPGELLGVCEVGLVGADTRALASSLADVGIDLWSGTVDEPGRLGFAGGRDGSLILAPEGRAWFPTGRPAEAHPVEAVVEGARDAETVLPGTAHRVRTIAP